MQRPKLPEEHRRKVPGKLKGLTRERLQALLDERGSLTAVCWHDLKCSTVSLSQYIKRMGWKVLIHTIVVPEDERPPATRVNQERAVYSDIDDYEYDGDPYF